MLPSFESRTARLRTHQKQTCRNAVGMRRNGMIGYLIEFVGDLDAIRTRDPQIRNLMLYPAELRDHSA